MGKYEKTYIDTTDSKEYQRAYKLKYRARRRANVRYLCCNVCGGKYTNEHVGSHKKLKKHINALNYLEEHDDFVVPPFAPIDMTIFMW